MHLTHTHIHIHTGPCMRRDRQLFEAINKDRDSERDQSGCCVRRDESGCEQVSNSQPCNVRLSIVADG